MKHNRLKHHAFTLCHMFCGWELLHDYKRLAELRQGILKINVLKKECFHNGKQIDPLQIVSVIQSWFTKDLVEYNISESSIIKAEITVEFDTDMHQGQKLTDVHWTKQSLYFIGCKLNCSSIIITDEKTYTSSYEDYEEWPENHST